MGCENFHKFRENRENPQNSEKVCEFFHRVLTTEIRSAMAGSAAGVMLAASGEPYRYGGILSGNFWIDEREMI